MRRVIGMDLHCTFAEVVIWEEGRLRHHGRIDMTRTALEGVGKSLHSTDEVVIEATGNCMAVSRVLSPFVARVVIANPLQVKAIAHAHVKTDEIDAGVLASLHAAGFLPQIWTPPPEVERMRRLVARRDQVVRHRTRAKNEVHANLHAHLIPRCPHADLFSRSFTSASRTIAGYEAMAMDCKCQVANAPATDMRAQSDFVATLFSAAV